MEWTYHCFTSSSSGGSLCCSSFTRYYLSLYSPQTESFCSLQVGEKLKLGAKTAIDIDKLRDGYRPAAKLGAVLFFVLSEMSAVNSMYQYSLASYLQVFDLSLRKSLPDSILPKRLKNIMDTLTMNVYNYACTGKGIPHDDLYDTLNP